MRTIRRGHLLSQFNKANAHSRISLHVIPEEQTVVHLVDVIS
jgi:hypothetical protein